MSHVLSGFNPHQSKQILEETKHEDIVEAFLSFKFYNQLDDNKDG